MGYDAFGLPAEQYAIEHGVHPADEYRKKYCNFRSQLDKIGFSFDWDPRSKIHRIRNIINGHSGSFCNCSKAFSIGNTNKAEPIENLIAHLKKKEIKIIPYRMQNSKYVTPTSKC